MFGPVVTVMVDLMLNDMKTKTFGHRSFFYAAPPV